MKGRVVITGLGVVTPLGETLEAFWSGLMAGRSGIRRVEEFSVNGFPCRIAGVIPDFRAEDHLPAKEARRMARVSQIAVAAGKKAVADAGLPLPLRDPERVGVYMGTAMGGLDKVDEGIEIYRTRGLDRVSPFTLPAALPNMPAFHVTQVLGAVGPNATFTTACAAGTQAVGEAAQAIAYGRADVVVAGGAEALIRYFTLGGFAVMRALPTNYNESPERASRPFDARREGFVFSEAAAVLVLESLEHARQRGARVYAEVLGYASSGDAYHIASLDPSAEGPARTMRLALLDADVPPESVDYINAHGTSTQVNDAVETAAIKRIFGERAYAIPVSATKSMVGHSLGAAGAVEAAVCALTISRGQIHPTVNYEYPDPACDLDYVPNQPREAKVEIALSNSFGLGGQNACLVLRRSEA
ncbi:MAG TPA: beta-ketoacyl-ACP synthase II [Anaerolineales bacterium]|nr:beta-ketoacyl-ACP synthase II [Anaerolineales bacterium]